MAQSVHGHEVLRILMDAPSAYTRESLGDVIANRFGADVRFHTCSKQDLRFSDLMDLFLAKGKVVSERGGLKMIPANVCDDF